MENKENDLVKASYDEVNSMSKYDCMTFVQKNEALLETLKKQLSGDNKVVKALEKMCRFLEQNGMNADQADFQEESKKDKKRSAFDHLAIAIYKFLCLAIKIVGGTTDVSGKVLSWLGKIIVKFGNKLDKLVDESGDIPEGERLLESFVDDCVTTEETKTKEQSEVEAEDFALTAEETSDDGLGNVQGENLEEDSEKINYWASLCDQEDL